MGMVIIAMPPDTAPAPPRPLPPCRAAQREHQLATTRARLAAREEELDRTNRECRMLRRSVAVLACSFWCAAVPAGACWGWVSCAAGGLRRGWRGALFALHRMTFQWSDLAGPDP